MSAFLATAKEHMDAFDALPYQLRDTLRYTLVNFSAISILVWLRNGDDVGELCNFIKKADHDDWLATGGFT